MMVKTRAKQRKPKITTLKQAKRIVTIVFGFTVLLLGVVMLALPGPGMVTIVLGLAMLGTEFIWAKRLYKRFEDGANNIKNSLFHNSKKAGASPEKPGKL